MTQSDFEIALRLQQQFEHEESIDNPRHNLSYSNKKPTKSQHQSLVDPSWELIDPTPNIHTLFVAFDQKYFWNKLQSVCVEWSKRMTSCAGICCYSGHGGLCRISLSGPLLKLRPRKDLIETLLHEMIHAYLFVTANNKDRDGHGPEFHKHMYRINNDAGTNITVYHDFIEEVRLYQQHWWRCNGQCQYRKPYFGMVRRAINRAPGPNDRWWDEHVKSCGGSFIKVKEPEKPKKISKTEQTSNTIDKYFPISKDKINNLNDNYKPTNNSNIVGIKNVNHTTGTATRTNSNGTIVITKRPATNVPKPSTITRPPTVTTVNVCAKNQPRGDDDYARVRNHWINKYPDSNIKNKRDVSLDTDNDTIVKRPKPNDTNIVNCPICEAILQSDEINSHLDKCLVQPIESTNLESPVKGNEKNDTDEFIECLVCGKNVSKINLNIHLEDCLDEIFTSDTNFNDKENETMKNDEIEEKYNCPVCSKKFFMNEMSDHLNVCLNNDNVFDIPF